MAIPMSSAGTRHNHPHDDGQANGGHDHPHPNPHEAADGEGDDGPCRGLLVNTGHGFAELKVFQRGVPPEFRFFFYGAFCSPRPLFGFLKRISGCFAP